MTRLTDVLAVTALTGYTITVLARDIRRRNRLFRQIIDNGLLRIHVANLIVGSFTTEEITDSITFATGGKITAGTNDNHNAG